MIVTMKGYRSQHQVYLLEAHRIQIKICWGPYVGSPILVTKWGSAYIPFLPLLLCGDLLSDTQQAYTNSLPSKTLDAEYVNLAPYFTYFSNFPFVFYVWGKLSSLNLVISITPIVLASALECLF